MNYYIVLQTNWVYGTFSPLFTCYFLTSRQPVNIWDRIITQHILNKRFGHMFVLPWNKFHLKPIRFPICECQHCLAITWAKWVFLHRLIKRHYCSLMSSSPRLSVRCVYYYNRYLSFPLKLTLSLGFGCKRQLWFFFFFFSPAGVFSRPSLNW